MTSIIFFSLTFMLSSTSWTWSRSKARRTSLRSAYRTTRRLVSMSAHHRRTMARTTTLLARPCKLPFLASIRTMTDKVPQHCWWGLLSVAHHFIRDFLLDCSYTPLCALISSFMATISTRIHPLHHFLITSISLSQDFCFGVVFYIISSICKTAKFMARNHCDH